MKYEHKVYARGFAIKVTPEDRAADVMHNIITGGLLGGRPLDGVEIELLDVDAQATKALSKCVTGEHK